MKFHTFGSKDIDIIVLMAYWIYREECMQEPFFFVDFCTTGVGNNLWTLDSRNKGTISIKRRIVEYIVVEI